MLTDHDYIMIRHIEKYKYCTIQHLQKVFYKHALFSYDIVRKRLLEMRKGGYIKEPYRDVVMNKNIYIYNEDKIKQPNQHRIIVLDFLAELVYNGFEIEIFEIEKSWYDGKYRSDAFVVGLFAGRRYHFFLEIQLSNNYHHLDKYDELYKTNDVQAFLGKNYYPNRIVLVSDKEYPQIKLERCKVIQLNTKLNNFPTIFMDLDK